MIRFLKIYCPNSVNINNPLNESLGKNIRGVNVHAKWTNAKIITGRLNTLRIRNTPMAVSHIASNIIETFEGINPMVKIVMVCFARSSAGLRCGKNFKAPNHRYTNPILIAKKRQPVICSFVFILRLLA